MIANDSAIGQQRRGVTAGFLDILQHSRGIDVAVTNGVMRSIATLLIALMLAGGPVARGACALWCHAMLPTAVHNCHDTTDDAAVPAITAAVTACSAAFAEGVAVRDDAPRVAPVLAVVDRFHSTDAVLDVVRASYGLFRPARPGPSSAAPLVLRI